MKPKSHFADETIQRPPFDIDQALERLGGDLDLLRDIVQIYFEDSPGMRKRIASGVREAQLSDVHKAAHALKGLAATLEARDVFLLCQEAERASAKKDVDAVRAAADELEPAVERLDSALRVVLSSDPRRPDSPPAS